MTSTPKPASLTAAAGGAGGSWYVLLKGIAQLVHEVHLNIEITVVEGGGIMNHERVGSGETPMAILNPPMTMAALAGRIPFDKPYPDIRVAVTNLTVNHLQFVVADSVPITSLDDWFRSRRPLRIPMDRVGTVDRMVFDMALEHFGVSDDDIEAWGGRRVPANNYDEQLDLYKRGEVDGFWQFMGIPAPAIEAAHALRPVKPLPLPAEFIDALRKLGWDAAEIPTGAYGVTTTPIPTVSMATTIGFHADVPVDVVYAVTGAVCDNADRVRRIHAAAADFDPTRAHLGAGGPLHPGAARYFTERGLIS